MRSLTVLFLVVALTAPAAAQIGLHFGYSGHHGGHYGVTYRLGHGYGHSYSRHTPHSSRGYTHYKRHGSYGYLGSRKHAYRASRYGTHDRYRTGSHRAYSYRYGSHGDRGSRGLRYYANSKHYRPYYRRNGYVPFVYSSRHDDDANDYREPESEHSGQTPRAWRDLEQGHYARALDRFTELASHHPSEGKPKIGYGIASAGIGAHHKAAWAMRRALRHDPKAFDSIYLGQSLRHRLGTLRGHYAEQLHHGHERDAWLMLNVLRYLDGQHRAVDEAIRSADRAYHAEARLLEPLLADKQPSEYERRGNLNQRGADHADDYDSRD